MSRRSILIIDDDPGALESFEPMLAARGYLVRVAPDAEAGFTALHLDCPSAILVDLHLPVVDGLEFVRRLRATPRHHTLPAAVVTGDYLIDDRITRELESLGARVYFKPLWEEDLAQIVDTLLGSEIGHLASRGGAAEFRGTAK